MEIDLTLVGQTMVIHILLAGLLTFVYGRYFSSSPGGSLLAIFAWLVPIIGPVCFAIYLLAQKFRRAPSNPERA